MDSVMNRPLFRRREARDRLNEMAGVQGFQEGGGVSAGMEAEARRRAIPTISDMSRPFTGGIVADPSGAIMRQYSQRPVRPAGLAALSPTRAENMAMDRESLFTNALLKAAEEKVRMAQNRFDNDPSGENLQSYRQAFADLQAMQQESAAFSEQYVPGPVATIRDRGILSLEGPESIPPDQLDIFNSLGRAAESAVPAPPSEDTSLNRPAVPDQSTVTAAPPNAPSPDAPALAGPTGMEAEARGSRPPQPAAQRPAPMFPSDMERDARGRGPLITNPAEVAAGLNAPDPAVRERTAADFMQEFMANAPQYEGGNKGLMHAMIGFAIAAGDSPNAMTNIAQGLQAGAQMFLQDKAAKDEFDRQLQLSAMQYGLQESSKARERSRQPLTFVALEDTTYKGRTVRAGEQVYIPYGEIERNGGMAPPGFGDTALATAMLEREKGYQEALNKAYEDRLVDDTFIASQRDAYSNATNTAVAAQRGIDFMEAAILKVGEENDITGIQGGVNDFVAKVAAAAGLDDIATEFGDRGQAVSLVQKAFQNLIPAALSGVQTANSISNRDIELLANAYVDSMMDGGVFSMATITEDKLLNSMKGALDLLQSSRQRSLTDLAAIEQTLSGRYLRSGNVTSPAPATSVLEPYRALIPGAGEVGVPSTFGTLYRSDDGVYDIMRPGG